MRKKGKIMPSGSRRPEDSADEVSSPAHQQKVGALFEEHNAALIRFLSARLPSEEEAREIAQEAYVKLLGLDEPDAINHFRAYLFRVARNLAADRLQQRHRRRELRNLALVGAARTSPSPERALYAAQKLAVIQEAVLELPAKCRTAFLLRRIHQFSTVEIAERMGLTGRMVNLYVARALAHCAERLESAKKDTNSIETRVSRTRHDQET